MKITINLFRMEFDGTIQMLKDYQREMELQLTKLQKEEKSRIEQYLKTIEDPDVWSEESTIAQDGYYYIYEVMFPRSLRYSFLVLLYLNLENLLQRFCDEISKRDGHTLRANDLRGDVVEKSRNYLHKLCKIPEVPKVVWDNIEDLSKIRNCVVHTLGEVDQAKKQTRIEDIVKNKDGILIGDSHPSKGFLVIESMYCEMVLEDVLNLFNELFEKAGFSPAIVR